MLEPFNNPIRDALVSIGCQAEALKLPFLLIGGNAVIHFGVPRFTRDIDFLIPEKSLEQWHSFLVQLGYRCYHTTGVFSQFESDSANMAPVDLMLVDLSTWQKLLAKAQRIALTADFAPWLPDPLHLIAMKLQASRSPHRQNFHQDWSDVEQLIRELKIDLRTPEVAQLVTRYGGDEALERLQKRTP